MGDGDLYPAVSMVYGMTEVRVKLKESTFSQSKATNETNTEKTDNLQYGTTDIEDEKCLTTTTSLHDTDVDDKQMHNDFVDQPPEKQKDHDQQNTSKEIERQQEDEKDDEDDQDELDEEVALATLPDTERQLLTIGHAWDDVARAGRIHLHPNAPDICVPARNFGDKVQGIRSKRQLKKGRHCWLLQEVRVYEPGSEEEGGKANNLIIGIGKHFCKMIFSAVISTLFS